MILNRFIQESTPIAAIGGIPSSGFGSDSMYLTQYRDDNGTKYGISSNILSDTILAKGMDGALEVFKTKKLLENTKFRIFKIKDSNRTKSILTELAKTIRDKDQVSDTYLYEVCTNKKLLSDDQLLVDPMLEEFDPLLEDAKTASLCYTIEEQYLNLINKTIPSVPVMSRKGLAEVSSLLKGINHITVYESMKGYYAKNDINGNRTAYYSEISKIPVFLIS